MGVEGLLAYILSSSDLRRVQLSILASSFQQETGKRPKLLFNLSEIAAEFWSTPITVLKKIGDYPEYTSICGPDFHLVADRVCSFVKALRSLGIEPVFFVDPPADHDSSERLQELMNENTEELANMYLIQQVLEHSRVQSLPYDNCNSLVQRQMLYSLRAESTEVVFCTQQTDSVIACYAQSHPETCGIVSDNSEFAIISGCVLFPLVDFDFENFTGLKNAVSVDKSPGEIISMAITSAALAESLEIREDQLPDLAVLCGMEGTGRFIRRLSVLTALGVEGSDVKEIAAWLKHKDTPLMANDVMRELCLLHPDFRDALEQSYNRFSPQRPSQVDSSQTLSYASPLYELVETEMLKYGELAFSAAKQGNVWLDVLCENLNLGQPSVMELLRPIRKNLYTLLGVREIREYGRTTSKPCEVRVVPVCANQEEVESSIKNLHSLRAMDRCARLVAAYRLTTVLSSQPVKDVTEIVDESSSQFPNMEWPQLHKLALVCCGLALMAHLNKASWPSLAITDRQLDALLVSSLNCATEGIILPHIVHVLPSMRAVSISEWFCVALDILYETLAILGVTDASPEPRNIFYPMAFIPYHLALESHSDLTPRQEVDILSVKTAMQTALSLPAVEKFRSCVFDTDELQPLPDLIILCSAALNEILENSEELLPRTMTASLEELVEPVKKDEDSSEDSSEDDDSSPAPELEMQNERKKKPLVWGKEELPIMEHRGTILELIAGHQVVCIEGETGCGKSSQVPQFILKQFQDSKILVSQPNSLAAKKLSERVTEELHVAANKLSERVTEEMQVSPDTVTYCDELHTGNESARLVYGTNGFTLQALLESQDTCSYTHVILDEIHERTTDIDFAMFLLRQLAAKFPELKVVLMSATLQGKLFVNYFKQTLGSSHVADPYFVGIRRFPVHVFFIDQLTELVSKRSDAVQENAMGELLRLQNKLQSDSSLLAHSAEVSTYAQEVCINLILSQPEPGDTILVFLPGMGDMIDLHSALLRRMNKLGIKKRFRIFVFHNQVPIEDEKEAFGKPRDGQANIIISHTIAESSITFPHLKMVINFAIRRCMIYDPKRHMSTLTRQWSSKASCTQREGRVGRLSEGTAIHLITKQDYDKLADFNLPDIATEPLSKTVLHAKKIIRTECGVSLPSQLLSSLIEPPSLLQFEAALHDLVEIGAIHHKPEESSLSEQAEITLLGEFCLGLPLDLRLCRLVLLGILFGCPLDAVVIAASLSMYKDIFTLPTRLVMSEMKNYCESLTRSTFSRLRFDNGCFSNAIMVRNMFLEWRRFLSNHLHSNRREMATQFSRTCAVRVTRLLHFETSVADISRAAAKWLPQGSRARAELVALSHIEKGKPLAPELCSNTYFMEKPLSTGPSLSLRPNSTPYIPIHLRNLPFQRTHGAVHQLHFCDDNILLKTLILAASPKDLMYGERYFDSCNPNTRAYARRCVKIAEEEGFYPNETLTMNLSSLADIDLWSEKLQKTDETTIHGLYDGLPRGFRFPLKVKVDKDTDTAVLYFYSSAEAANNVMKIARDMGYVFGGSTVDRSTANLSRLSPELQVLWRLGECRDEWEIEGVNAVFPYLGHPCQLRWVMLDKDTHPVNSIYLNYRNPTGLMCVFKAQSYPYLAVASRCFLSADDVMMTPLITLLPPPPQSLMMILAFQLPTSVTELLVDRTAGKVKRLRLNHNEITCDNIESYISEERLRAINRLRLSLSNALSSSFHNKQISLDELTWKELHENLAAVLASSAEPDLPSPKEQAMTTDLSGSGTEDLMWEMITPGKLLDEATSNSDQFYYPELRCSLLGSEPYATVAARVDQSTLPTTPSSILYKETVSTKLLLDNFERLEKSTEFDDEHYFSGNDELNKWITDQGKGATLVKEKLRAPIQLSGRSEKEVSAEAEGEGATPSESKKNEASVRQRSEMPTRSISFPELVTAKLEQEIVRHLQRNNKMEFLSELRIQRRIKHVCSLVRMTLNVPFFLQRPNLFQVREVEEGGEGADAAISGREYLIVLDQSKWRDVESDEEEPVLPPSVRIVKKSQKVAASAKKPIDKVATQEGGASSALPIVKEPMQTSSKTNTLTEKIPSRNSTNADSAEDKQASKVVKSSHSKPLTATKAVKLSETKASTPHSSVVEDKKKVDTSKKPDPATGKPLSATKSSAHPEVTDQAKSAPAKKSTASKKKGPQPGSDDHLALHLHDYIKRHGGEVRLAVMRKEAFPEYYEKHPNLRYGGYRYLRKMFLLDYPEYFEIYEDNKILYVRAVEEKEAVASSKSRPTTHDTKQEKKTAKQGQGKEGGKKTVTPSGNQEPTQQSSKSSSTAESRVVNGKKDKPLTSTGTEKTDKHAHVATEKMDSLHPSKQAVQSSKPDAVQFVQVPSSSRLSQEPIGVSELDTDSSTMSQSTPSHSLSQSRSHPQTSDQQVITQILSLGSASDPPQQQPTSDQIVHVTALESAPPEAAAAASNTWIPLGKSSEATIKTPATGGPLGAAPGIVLTSEAVQVPVKPPVHPVPGQHPPSTGAGRPSVSAEGSPAPSAAGAAVPPPPGTVEEDEWHSSEESWLSEEEFETGQGSPGHIARFLYNYLSTHSLPFGCRVSELDRVYQNDYKQKFHSKKVATITAEFLQSHSKLFKLREETFLKLREGFEHVESASNSFRGRPYTPEHINEYYSKYLGNEGVVCSLLEAQHVFETSYRKEFKMPPSPLIWFVGESFFKRSFHQFVLFNDIIVLRNEGKQ